MLEYISDQSSIVGVVTATSAIYTGYVVYLELKDLYKNRLSYPSAISLIRLLSALFLASISLVYVQGVDQDIKMRLKGRLHRLGSDLVIRGYFE